MSTSGHRLARWPDFEEGQTASFSKTLGDAQIRAFAELTGDTNPLHLDDAFAEATFFGGRIVPGLLTGALMSTVIGTLLPGTGAIYRSQSFDFVKPVRPGDRVTATVVVESIDAAENRIELRSTVVNQRGETVVTGRSVVSLLKGYRDDDGEDDDGEDEETTE